MILSINYIFGNRYCNHFSYANSFSFLFHKSYKTFKCSSIKNTVVKQYYCMY